LPDPYRTPLPDSGAYAEYFGTTDAARPQPYRGYSNDSRRSTMTDNQTDLFVSAPSTPMTSE
jgi:hypothetical protein